MEIEEVFDAIIASGDRCFSRSLKMLVFRSSFSGAASITRSHLLSPSYVIQVDRFSSAWFLSASEIDKAGPGSLSDKFRLDRPGQVVGTPAYMSPEVLKGLTEDASVKKRDTILQSSDVYALGVVFYKMLTGQLPYTGTFSETFAKIVEGKAKRPKELNPEIPKEVSNFVMRMMDKDYNKRPKSVAKEGEPYLLKELSKLEKALKK